MRSNPHMRSSLALITMAMAMSVGTGAIGNAVASSGGKVVVKPKRHDPERVAAAEAKRARKAAKRLAVG